MRRITLSFAALVLVACGGKSSAPPSTATTPATTEPAPAPTTALTGQVVLARFGEFRDQMCACQDVACAERLEQGMMEWATAHIEELKAIEPTSEEDATADRMEAEMDACRERLSASSVTAAELLAGMEGFKVKVCACNDGACVEKVEREMVEWAMARMDAMKHLKPTPAEDAEADRIQAEMETCKTRVAGKP